MKKLFENVSRLYLKDMNKVREAREFLNKIELDLAVVELEKQWRNENERLTRG